MPSRPPVPPSRRTRPLVREPHLTGVGRFGGVFRSLLTSITDEWLLHPSVAPPKAKPPLTTNPHSNHGVQRKGDTGVPSSASPASSSHARGSDEGTASAGSVQHQEVPLAPTTASAMYDDATLPSSWSDEPSCTLAHLGRASTVQSTKSGVHVRRVTPETGPTTSASRIEAPVQTVERPLSKERCEADEAPVVVMPLAAMSQQSANTKDVINVRQCAECHKVLDGSVFMLHDVAYCSADCRLSCCRREARLGAALGTGPRNAVSRQGSTTSLASSASSTGLAAMYPSWI